ncbi:MAG TPA: hypothetical protein VI451_13410 [Anaerolineales bacterium]|nr:hypothetical protein [Anaerolineales bacterium]
MHIGNGQCTQKGQDGRFFDLPVAVQSLLNGGVDVRVAIILQPTAQAGQVRGIRVCGGTIFLQMLHAVGVKRRPARQGLLRRSLDRCWGWSWELGVRGIIESKDWSKFHV